MQIISDAFHLLLKAETVENVDRIPNQLGIPEKYRMEFRYPDLAIGVSKREVKKLMAEGILNSNYQLTKIKNDADPVTRLLYALLWKTGDLVKLKPVIAGILDDENRKETGLVYRQFGRFLSEDIAEPIIDQHIIRAFGIFRSGDDLQMQQYYKNLTTMSKRDISIIDDYKHWLKNELLASLRRQPGYTYHVDKVLFAAGKMVKK